MSFPFVYMSHTLYNISTLVEEMVHNLDKYISHTHFIPQKRKKKKKNTRHRRRRDEKRIQRDSKNCKGFLFDVAECYTHDTTYYQEEEICCFVFSPEYSPSTLYM